MRNTWFRKKCTLFGFLVLAVVLLLMLMMQSTMAETCTHTAFCTDPYTCFYCGKTVSGDGIKIDHIWHDGEWISQFNETEHWDVCTDCNETAWGPYKHFASCTDPDTCYQCGKTVSGDGIKIGYIRHDGEQISQFSETEHWKVCSGCNEITWGPYLHHAYCYGHDFCYECHKSVSEDGIKINDIVHYPEVYVPIFNEIECYWWCPYCKIVLWGPIKHTAYCIDPDTCYECYATASADGIKIDSVIHNNPEMWEYDTEFCWKVCRDCGEKNSMHLHQANCSDPGTCVFCGNTTENDTIKISIVQHHYSSDTQFSMTPEHHIRECSDCGKNIEEPHDWIETPNTDEAPYCSICGYKKEKQKQNSGDCNGDGVVDGRDSLRLLKWLAGQGVIIDEKACDVNDDGTVDGRDSIRLLKMLAN